MKGKVERGVGYLKTSVLEGRSFTDLDDLNQQLEHWLDTVANVRVHGTTGERPADRHREELAQLRPAAAVPAYDIRPVEIRKVTADCHFSFGGTRYSTPPQASGHTVTVRPSGEHTGDPFAVYLGDDLLAEHRRAPKGIKTVTLPAHAEAIRQICRRDPSRARGRPGKQPTYEQVPAGEPLLISTGHLASPIVEVGTLEAYERFAEGAVL